MSGLAGIGLGAKLLGVRSALAKVPRPVWIALAVAAALLVGVLWHHHAAGKALKAADKAGYERRDAEVKAAALKLKARIDGLTKKISDQERALNAQAHNDSNRAADALLVRGPGKAVCSVRAEPASPAIRPSGGSSVAVNGGVAQLLDPGGQPLIALPFADSVAFAREHDACQIDRRSWEQWYGKLVKAWPKH